MIPKNLIRVFTRLFMTFHFEYCIILSSNEISHLYQSFLKKICCKDEEGIFILSCDCERDLENKIIKWGKRRGKQ